MARQYDYAKRLGLAMGASLAIHVVLMLLLDALPYSRWPQLVPQEHTLLRGVLAAANPPGISMARPEDMATSLAIGDTSIAPAKDSQPEPAGKPPQPQPGVPFETAYYYRTPELDVAARPIQMSSPPRSQRSAALGRLIRIKLELFINESGTIDRINVLESDGRHDSAVLEDLRELRFQPAVKNGEAVKSRKVVELSFIP